MKRILALIFATISSLLFWNSCSQKEQDIPVAFVTLSQPAAEMIIGEFITLKATISPSNATEREIMWASSKQSVASVDQTGKVVAIAEGTSTITATAGGKLGSCVVTVSKGVVEVSSINFDKTGVSLKVGETVTLTATVKPDDATDKTVTWSTSDASVATVSDGVVTAIKLGSATIRAKAGDKEATCAITVEATPVTSVTLDQTSASLKVGETVTLTATVKPDDATDKTVTWSTSDASVATVSDGVVTAFKLGSATIRAKAGDKEATCAITVEATPVTSVTLDQTSASLKVGETVSLTATVKPDDATDKSVTWSSSNTSVATVSSSGIVTAIKAGSATITVNTNDGGKTATCSLTVNPAQEAVDLGLPSGLKWASCNIGAIKPEEYGDYYAWGETETKENDCLETYKWGSGSNLISFIKYNTNSQYGTMDNKTILDPDDDVAYEKLGGKWRMPSYTEWTELSTKCSWTQTTQNGVYGKKVTGPNGNSIFLPAAGCQIGTNLKDVGSNGFYLSSSLDTDNPYLAWFVTFSTYVNRYFFTRGYGLSVRPVYGDVVSVQSVSLNTTSLSLTEGETQTLTATVSPSNATNNYVLWSSSNTSVATVSSSGIVTAEKAGSATITVKTNDGGKTATCSVTVKAATVPVAGVSLNTTSLSLTEGETQTLTATVSPSNATDKSVTWSSNNTSVATVSSTGVVTAKSVGSAIITVTTKDGSKTATCSVTVKAKTVSVTGVSLDYTSLTMTEGETQTLTATISPSNATDKSVTWSSSNTSVATVSSAGVVTAKAAGTVTITVKTNDGNKTATCIVTVQEEKPSYYHIISSAEELIAFRNYINNGGEEQNGRLTADITISDTWQGIGTESQPFSGIFDGNGHSVSGLSCQSSYSGLFGVVKNATIHNLTVSGSFSNGQYMGGIAGMAISSTIDNCQSSINISSGSYLGGIVGSSENCTISNCAHTENTIGNTSSNKVGGIAGQTSSQTEIYNCYNAGRIYGSDCFGGIVGYNGGNCSITNCYNKAAFKNMYYIDTGGGIVGYNCGRIVNCYSSGSMTCKTINGDMGMKNCGGVVGYNHTGSSCYCCYFLQQSPINNGLSFVGDLNWGSCSKCGPFDASGLFSSSSLSYSGNTKYLRTSLNQWVSSNQTSDNKYKRWRTDQSWPDFVQ